MPKQSGILKEEQGNKTAFNKAAPKQSTPAWVNNPASGAWANYNKKNKDEVAPLDTVLASNSFSSAAPQTLQTAIPNAPASGGGAALQTAIPNKPGTYSSFNKPKLQPVFEPEPGTYSSESNPAWMNPAVYTGMAQYYAPFHAAQNPATMIPTYQGMPVGTSFSDTLRGLIPPKRGNGPSMSDYLRSIQAGNYTPGNTPFNRPKPASTGNGGFSSSYGGNWGGGGGYGDWGGGGGWGGGYGERPAWTNYMQGLYSWNIK